MKYCPEIIKEIAGYLRDGMNRTDACTLAGIHYDTFTEWMRGEVPKGFDKAEFSEAIKKAETEAKQQAIQVVRKAMGKTWQAGAWWLERKHKDEFSLRQEVTGKNGKDLGITLNIESQEQAKKLKDNLKIA